MINKVEQWFKDRNMQDADPQKQMLKLMEEVGELSAAITRSDEIETIDALGDIQVVLIGLALQLDHNPKYLGRLDTIKTVEQWFIDRDVHSISTHKQMLELMWEIGKLSEAISRNNKIVSIEGLISVQAVLIGLALQLNLNLNNCLEHAYSEIKDRKGKIVNGIFVKEEDLNNKEIEKAHKAYTKAINDYRRRK